MAGATLSQFFWSILSLFQTLDSLATIFSRVYSGYRISEKSLIIGLINFKNVSFLWDFGYTLKTWSKMLSDGGLFALRVLSGRSTIELTIYALLVLAKCFFSFAKKIRDSLCGHAGLINIRDFTIPKLRKPYSQFGKKWLLSHFPKDYSTGILFIQFN